MPIILRVLLLTAATLTAYWILRKIRRSQIKTDDAIFWVVFSLSLIALAIFPDFTLWLAVSIGIESSDSFVFLFTIAMLLLKVFMLAVRLSVLENKVSTLTAELIIQLKEKQDVRE